MSVMDSNKNKKTTYPELSDDFYAKVFSLINLTQESDATKESCKNILLPMIEYLSFKEKNNQPGIDIDIFSEFNIQSVLKASYDRILPINIRLKIVNYLNSITGYDENLAASGIILNDCRKNHVKIELIIVKSLREASELTSTQE